MNPHLKNLLALLVGVLVGSAVNMGFFMGCGYAAPPPVDVDVSTTESLQTSLQLFQPGHFIFPLLAHSLGALSGACVAGWLAASYKIKAALVVGGFFLAGGIASMFMLPSPFWFSIVDLTGLILLPLIWA